MSRNPDVNDISTPLFVESYPVLGGNYLEAGGVSTKIKDLLKELAVPPEAIRRTAICSFEAEMNVVMYAQRGTITLEILPSELILRVQDEGPGIPDIELAMQEGYSTATADMRSRGFGAGMGLPNIQRNSDEFRIESEVGKGTHLFILIKQN
jgi:anti-sigma regulatory factor (Ser/Thr protein kinase)